MSNTFNHDELCATIVTDQETDCNCLVGEYRKLQADYRLAVERLQSAKAVLDEANRILGQAQVLHDLSLCPACGNTNKAKGDEQ